MSEWWVSIVDYFGGGEHYRYPQAVVLANDRDEAKIKAALLYQEARYKRPASQGTQWIVLPVNYVKARKALAC